MKDDIKATPLTHSGSSEKLEKLMISEAAPFHIREAFKTIRTNLLFTLATKESKTFVVASAMPDEGKSTTAANLSVVLAQTGAQVLLMDCDFRKPSVHRLFKLSIDKGLTSILCGIDKIEEALNENVVPNLDIITAGPMSPNPSELLGSSRMAELLAIVQKAYDYVVIDASPINIVSDAIIVSKQTAGIVLVSRQGQSKHDQLKKAIESCEFARVNILGLVLNESKSANSHYYGYRYNQHK
ncbi:MAG: CpsD/CapB family tyrosine-protein kinase [Oscillospiraceae bacterium]|nr:CpsD/CapB family tyrosine-protein kinase [Oscillospiraceae bacterium]MDD3832605.1 CpsD/CapB family tyrosine-protein kinase [Oscillospiraceae bacterium]MDD4546599.1 CpsD/CapB family tyrosine-protein kinase [Oscillospiraceae bacterium]